MVCFPIILLCQTIIMGQLNVAYLEDRLKMYRNRQSLSVILNEQGHDVCTLREELKKLFKELAETRVALNNGHG